MAGKRREGVVRLHQNAQRLLRPLAVVNPYAPELTFLDTQIRTRRDHEKYLTLIDSIALLHQHQRETKRARLDDGRTVEYVEVELGDVEVANRLAREVLGRSLDELPPQTRRLLGLLDRMVGEASDRLSMDRSDYRFTRREVRESTGWSYDQVRVHLGRLVELEYVLVHQGGRGQSFVYELLYEAGGEEGAPVLPGLIDVAKLRERGKKAATKSLGGSEAALGGEGADLGGPLDPLPTPIGGGLEGAPSPAESATCRQNPGDSAQNTRPEAGTRAASRRSSRRPTPSSLVALGAGDG